MYGLGFIYSFFLVPMILYLTVIMFVLMNLPITLFFLTGAILISIYLGKKLKISRVYLLPLLFGFIGSIVGYFISTDKKLAKRLLMVGLLISLSLFIFYSLFIYFTIFP
jgi:hypothetical protein